MICRLTVPASGGGSSTIVGIAERRPRDDKASESRWSTLPEARAEAEVEFVSIEAHAVGLTRLGIHQVAIAAGRRQQGLAFKRR